MDSAPGVSVLMPAHGPCPFIEDSVASCLRQRFPGPWELIIVTGTLQGTARDYLATLTHAHVRKVPQLGRGLVDALNTGIAAAQFDVIVRMDADDVMLPDRVARQLAALESDESLVAVGGQLLLADNVGVVHGRGYFPVSKERARARARFQSPLAHPTVCMRKSAVDAVGGYRESYVHAEDVDLWLRLLKVGNVRSIPAFVLIYREHEAQLTGVNEALVDAYALKAIQEGRSSGPVGAIRWRRWALADGFRRKAVRTRRRGYRARAQLSVIAWALARPAHAVERVREALEFRQLMGLDSVCCTEAVLGRLCPHRNDVRPRNGT